MPTYLVTLVLHTGLTEPGAEALAHELATEAQRPPEARRTARGRRRPPGRLIAGSREAPRIPRAAAVVQAWNHPCRG